MKLVHLAPLVFLSVCFSATASTANSSNSIIIDRKNKTMQVIDSSGETILSTPVGIGRGGLKGKNSMQDCITPTGYFVVDVVLTLDPALNQIAPQQASTVSPRFSHLVKDSRGLAKIFETMNSQDFNRDGKPDRAYGYAFIGIDGKNTGPKLIAAGKSARWYSIALHGSPKESKAIGAATSEGCIHVPERVLKQILRGRIVGVGTPVHITDEAELRNDVKRKSSDDDNKEQVRMRN